MNKRWRNVLIVLSATLLAFFIGGGWRFFSDEERYGLWHNTHSDWEYIASLESMFSWWGIAQAITAFTWTLLIIGLMPRWRRHLWLWAFLVVSIIFGGYKFFVSPGEYFIAPVAGKQLSLLAVWTLPFFANGGAVGLFAACIAGIIQWRSHRKPSPSQEL